MRDLLIVSLVLAGAVLALRRPWIGVMNWTWLSIMNPHRYAWGIAYSAPLAAIAAASTLVGLVLTKERQSPFQGAPVWWLAALTMWITLSWQLGIDPAGDYPMWDRVIKIYLMTFVALALLRTRYDMLAFAWVTIGSLGVLATKGGLFTVLKGGNYRVFGPPSSFIADNNDFALATVVCIPMIRFLQLQVEHRWLRHGLTVVMLLSAASALGSHSRGGLLALIGMAGVFWLRSQHRIKTGALIAVAALALLPFMPEHWWERMHTIRNYQEDGSAMGRINAWIVAWHTAQEYFFGGGMSYQHQFLFDQYGPYENTVRAAHSIYFQILGNHGFVGLFIYLMMWISAFRCAGWLRKHAREAPETKWAADLGSMVQVSLAGFAVGGSFLSLSYFDLPYNLMVLVVLAKAWVMRRGWETDPQVSFLEYAGIKRPPPRPPGMAAPGAFGTPPLTPQPARDHTAAAEPAVRVAATDTQARETGGQAAVSRGLRAPRVDQIARARAILRGKPYKEPG